MYDVIALRKAEFPHSEEIIYLNHAGISPLPARTHNSTQQTLAKLARNPVIFWQQEITPLLVDLKEQLARLINAHHADEIVTVTSTSTALNLVAQSISWQPGDNIAFCRLEFPANAYPWMALAREGVETRLVPPDNGGLTVAALRPFVDERTRVVAVSSVQFFTGHRSDLMALGEFCRQRGILFVVDAIQSIGHIPVDVQAMHIDVLASGGQKSILGLPGTGFLYVRDTVCEGLRPRSIHSTSTVDYLHWLHYDLTPLPGAARFGTGTSSLVGIVALHSSLQLLMELGIPHIDAHTRALSAVAIARLTDLGLRVITPADNPGPIVTFASDRNDAATDQLIADLQARQIFVVKHLDDAGNPHIRASFHCYNTHEEVALFVEALGELVDSG